MQGLDLKFVSHHGEFIKHRMAGREELAGRDVIVIHRLLKNAVKERLGGHAYALYSDTCVQAMDIDPVVQGLVEHQVPGDGGDQLSGALHGRSGGEPVFEVGIEALLRLARLQVEKAQDQRAGKAEQRG